MEVYPTSCPGVKVVSEDTEMGFMIINEKDFDPNVHKMYVEKPEKAAGRKKLGTDETE